MDSFLKFGLCAGHAQKSHLLYIQRKTFSWALRKGSAICLYHSYLSTEKSNVTSVQLCQGHPEKLGDWKAFRLDCPYFTVKGYVFTRWLEEESDWMCNWCFGWLPERQFSSQSTHTSAFRIWLLIFTKPGCRMDTNATIRTGIQKWHFSFFCSGHVERRLTEQCIHMCVLTRAWHIIKHLTVLIWRGSWAAVMWKYNLIT